MQNIQPLCLINAIRQAFNTGEAPEQLAGQVNNRSNDAGEPLNTGAYSLVKCTLICYFLKLDVFKIYQTRVCVNLSSLLRQDGEEMGDDEATPHEVGHNIYILAYQVSREN